jgi:hypothetical protein
MTAQAREYSSWQAGTLAALEALQLHQVPAVEVLLLDALAAYILSTTNPGEDYGSDHGVIVVGGLLSAVESAASYQPERMPPETPESSYMRSRFVAGAHEIAAEGDEGLGLLISRIMPAAIGELNRNAGDVTGQLYNTFLYAMFAVTGGQTGAQEEASMRGIMDVFAGWDALMVDGFRSPSRA